MADTKVKLKDNPRAALEPYISNLQSESKLARKKALDSINYEIFENPINTDCDLIAIFPEIYVYILKSFTDDSEVCRETAAAIISNFIDKLPLNDYYLTYILPMMVRRLGCPEIVEQSEEIRLQLICLFHKIIKRYKNSQLLGPFMNECTSILTKTSTDPYPKVKLETCECVILLSKAVERDFYQQCESYVKPMLTNFAHQHFRVRVACIKAIGAIVSAGNGKCFELSITPLAEKLFDEHSKVRLQITLEVGNWMLTLRDRYSFWHRMIPLLLTSMSDVSDEIREVAAKLWNDIGLQYQEENEEDLKKKSDFLRDIPTHYPDVPRPNRGCRTLVQYNISKIVPAIGREMDGWQSDARLRVSQLLCWLLLCAEEGSTQHSTMIIRTMHRGAQDDDERIVKEIKRSAELFGYFIGPETWWPVMEPDMDSWGMLLVLANILKGSQKDHIKGKYMMEITKMLADPNYCQTRKAKYQNNLLRVADALITLCKEDCKEASEQIFTMCFTVYALTIDDNIKFSAIATLDRMRYVIGIGRKLPDLYAIHAAHTLSAITSDALAWTLTTPDRCILEAVLTEFGPALGGQLHLLSPLLKECLGTPKVDPEVKLRMFTTLSAVLLKRQTNFAECDVDILRAFLKIIVQDVIMVNLVWSAGRTGEAIRTAAVACLCSAIQDVPTENIDAAAVQNGDGDKDVKRVLLFPNKESLEPLLDELIPLLVGLADDNSTLTRQHTLRAIACLAALAKNLDCFTSERLHKLYFVVLKRLDDSSDKVRSFAVQATKRLFQNRPLPYDTITYSAHIDAMYSSMLVHLDDTEEAFRKEMLEALLSLVDVDPNLLFRKVKSNIHLYRNKAAYEKLSSHIEKILS